MRALFPSLRIVDPLALSASAGARLLLAAGVLAVLWAAVVWALAA
jgi:hypothetical protein